LELISEVFLVSVKTLAFPLEHNNRHASENIYPSSTHPAKRTTLMTNIVLLTNKLYSLLKVTVLNLEIEELRLFCQLLNVFMICFPYLDRI
jgi:hypothetical protein